MEPVLTPVIGVLTRLGAYKVKCLFAAGFRETGKNTLLAYIPIYRYMGGRRRASVQKRQMGVLSEKRGTLAIYDR